MSIDSKAILVGLRKYPIIVICGFISFILAVVLYYRGDLRAEQEAQLNSLSAQNAQYRANITNSVQLQDQLEFLIQANKAVKARALSVEGIAQNLQYFYRLEIECGVRYLELGPGASSVAARPDKGKQQQARPDKGKQQQARPDKGKQQQAYLPISYTIGVEGDFNQIISYLRRLEQGVYFCRINTAAISGNGSVVTLNLNLDMLGVP
jgi:hypothetical protein